MNWTKTTDDKGNRVHTLTEGTTVHGTITAVHTTGTGVTLKVEPTNGDAVWVDKLATARRILTDTASITKDD